MPRPAQVAIGIALLAAMTAFIGIFALAKGPTTVAMAAGAVVAVGLAILLATVAAQIRSTHVALREQIQEHEKRAKRRARATQNTLKDLSRVKGALTALQRQSRELSETVERLEFAVGALGRQTDLSREAWTSTRHQNDLSAAVAQELSARAYLEERFAPEGTVGFSGPPPSAIFEALLLQKNASPKRLLVMGFEEQAQWFPLAFKSSEIETVDAGTIESLQRPMHTPNTYEPWYDVTRITGTFDVAFVSDSIDVYPAVPLLASLIPDGKIIIVGEVPLNVRRAWESMEALVKTVRSFSHTTEVDLAGNR